MASDTTRQALKTIIDVVLQATGILVAIEARRRVSRTSLALARAMLQDALLRLDKLIGDI